MSEIPLRSGKGKRSLDVDHTVAYAQWDTKVSLGLPTGIETKDEALALVNMLGNCSLLEKSFNISKSDKTLRSFMEEVHEFKEGKVDLASWALALHNASECSDDGLLRRCTLGTASEWKCRRG